MERREVEILRVEEVMGSFLVDVVTGWPVVDVDDDECVMYTRVVVRAEGCTILCSFFSHPIEIAI